jgi:hypothetical protein
MNGPDPPLTAKQQEQFAAFMCDRLPVPKGAKEHQLYAFTEYSNRVLGRKLLHWRGLRLSEAQAVMAAVKTEYPLQPQNVTDVSFK